MNAEEKKVLAALEDAASIQQSVAIRVILDALIVLLKRGA